MPPPPRPPNKNKSKRKSLRGGGINLGKIKKTSGPVSLTVLEMGSKTVVLLGDYHSENLPLCANCKIDDGCYTVQNLLEYIAVMYPGTCAVFLELFSENIINPYGLLSNLDLAKIKADIYKFDIRTPAVLNHFITWLKQQETRDLQEIYELLRAETIKDDDDPINTGLMRFLPKNTLGTLEEDQMEFLFYLDEPAPSTHLNNLLADIDIEDIDYKYLHYNAAVALLWIIDMNFVNKFEQANKDISVVFAGKAHIDKYEEYFTTIGYDIKIKESVNESKCMTIQ
jgi:hypothetical protein